MATPVRGHAICKTDKIVISHACRIGDICEVHGVYMCWRKSLSACLGALIDSTVTEHHLHKVSEKWHFSFWICSAPQDRPRSIALAYSWFFQCSWYLHVLKNILLSAFVGSNQHYIDRRPFCETIKKFTFFFFTWLMPPTSCLELNIVIKTHSQIVLFCVSVEVTILVTHVQQLKIGEQMSFSQL